MTIIDAIINKINTTSSWIIISIFIIILISVVYIYRLFFIEANKVPGYNKEGFTINKDITIADVNDIGAGDTGDTGDTGDAGNDDHSFDKFYATIYQDLFYRDFVDDYESDHLKSQQPPEIFPIDEFFELFTYIN